MRPQDYIGEQIGHQQTLEARLQKCILTGAPLVVHQQEDREFAEWLSRRITDKMSNNKRGIKLHENHRILTNGLAEGWRKHEITVQDCTQLPRGEVRFYPEDRETQDWLHECMDRPPHCIVVCNPEQWELIVENLKAMGYTVRNADAPPSPPQLPHYCPPEREPQSPLRLTAAEMREAGHTLRLR